MSDTTQIEWTDATWNPTTGCTKISPGCAHCYIERTAAFRIAGRKFVKGHIPLQMHEDRLDKPLHWRRPRRIFVNSLSDLFHKDMPVEFIDRVFATMALAPQHVFQVLTKRPERMHRYLWGLREDPGHAWRFRQARDGAEPNPLSGAALRFRKGESLPNVWLGVSVEDKVRKHRIDLLRDTPAAVRFLSIEPLLEPLGELDLRSIDWVIIGGESGPGARPLNLDWIRSVVQQCKTAGVSCFVKQVGATVAGDSQLHQIDCQCGLHHGFKDKKGGDPAEWPEDLRVREFPK